MQKVALITGCSTGIGRELALQLKMVGWQVVATARNPETLDVPEKAGCIVFPLDVTLPDQIESTVRKVIESCGRIDLLVNNAGYGLISPTLDIPLDGLLQQFKTNVIGGILMIQKVVPLMKLQGEGTIVNIGSISGIAPTPFSGAYCASKAAIHAWSDVLRMELKPFGISVVSVQPGGIKTDFGINCTRTVDNLLKPDSLYSGIGNFIYARANTSQEKATSVEVFIQKIIRKITRPNPPAIIRAGKRSFTLPLMKRCLPVKLLDRMMIKKYGLNSL
jgi:NAD(P)-dependent dehydrogenase (short-subunit alcohol dehydrogenase family)